MALLAEFRTNLQAFDERVEATHGRMRSGAAIAESDAAGDRTAIETSCDVSRLTSAAASRRLSAVVGKLGSGLDEALCFALK